MTRTRAVTHAGLRRRVIAAMRGSVAAGLNHGTAGNGSVRVKGGFLITPSALSYDAMTQADIVALDAAGRQRSDGRKPSSEWRFHKDIYAARSEVAGIVHAHPPFATALACQRRSIPAFHYMVAAAGGADIRCAAYATYGTQKLSDNVLRALDGRTACLMANHGLVAVGADIEAALRLAVEVEALAAQYVHALTLGTPKLLSAAEMKRVLAKFADYRREG